MISKNELLREIESILRRDESRFYSREEILNLISPKESDMDAECVLAELEVASSMKESQSDIYATCRGGTVYFKWNK